MNNQETRPCPACGASNRPGVRNCWLCQQPLSAQGLPPRLPSRPSPPPPRRETASEVKRSYPILILVFLILLRGIFAWFGSVSGLLVIILLIPMILSLFKDDQARPGVPGPPPTPGSKLARICFAILGSFGLVVGTLALGAVFLVIIAFITCLQHPVHIE